MVKVNGTSNFSKGSWQGIAKHVEHDPKINHSNKDIDFSQSKFNIGGQFMPFDVAMYLHYGQFVKDHDVKARENRHADRCYGSVENYIQNVVNKKNNGPEMTAVFTVGDMATKEAVLMELKKRAKGKMTDQQVEDTYRKSQSEALEYFAKHYGLRHSAFSIGHYQTNVDEKGAPHLHAEVYKWGHTGKNNKPSGSLNAALKQEYGLKDSRACLSKMREEDDKELVALCSKSLKKSFAKYGVKSPSYTFTRKPDHNDELNQQTWTKAQKVVIDSIAAADQSLANARSSVANAKRSVAAKLKAMESHAAKSASEFRSQASLEAAQSASREIMSASLSLNQSVENVSAEIDATFESRAIQLNFEKSDVNAMKSSVAVGASSNAAAANSLSSLSSELNSQSEAQNERSEQLSNGEISLSAASSAVANTQSLNASKAASRARSYTESVAEDEARRFKAVGYSINYHNSDVTTSIFDPDCNTLTMNDSNGNVQHGRQRVQLMRQRLSAAESDAQLKIYNMTKTQLNQMKSAYGGALTKRKSNTSSKQQQNNDNDLER